MRSFSSRKVKVSRLVYFYGRKFILKPFSSFKFEMKKYIPKREHVTKPFSLCKFKENLSK